MQITCYKAKKVAIESSVFMCTMLLSANKIFFEETSLIGYLALSFDVCNKY